MTTTTVPTLESLHSLTSSELRDHYQHLFPQAPPRHASQTFLRCNIAWFIQAKEDGHDPIALRTTLIDQLQTTQGINCRKPKLAQGTRLIREWQGTVYEVTVTDNGYIWEGRTYKSLSPIATTITGTRWSGPRFFGIKGKADVSYKSSGALL